MKKTYILLIISTIILSCTNDAIDPSDIFFTEDKVAELTQDGRIYTLEELKNTFMTERGNFYDSVQTYRTRAYKYIGADTMFLFSIDTLPKGGPGIYIRGRITTDDVAGNFYKSLVIQQIVEGKQQALRVSVDMGSVGGMYAKGQEILIRCNGLAIGRYANQPQLCVPSYNNNIYATNAEQKVGWAPGRIPAPMFIKATTRIGLPDASKIRYDVMTIADIVGSNASMDDKCEYFDQITVIEQARNMDGLAICVRNLHCTGEYSSTDGTMHNCTTYNPNSNTTNGIPGLDGNANVFGPTTANIGYPQSRIFADATDNSSADFKQRKVINLSTSEYARYAHYYLPAKIMRDENNVLTFDYSYYSGDVYGILGFYMDNGRYNASKFAWSISPSSLSDLQLRDSTGGWWIDNALEFSLNNF